MKQLTCEMCGSTDLIKQDGLFVCQFCGCKYSAEEAKKMMIEGTVDVTGSTVKIDNSSFVEKYLANARRAYEKEDWEEVEKYYNMVEQYSSNNMEAVFFSAYGKAMLSMSDSDYYKREQKFNVLNKSISVISDCYEKTTENKSDVLFKITNAITAMRKVDFVYDMRAIWGMVGSKKWQHRLIDEVTRTFAQELNEIMAKHDDEYLNDLIGTVQHFPENLTDSTLSNVAPPKNQSLSLSIAGLVLAIFGAVAPAIAILSILLSASAMLKNYNSKNTKRSVTIISTLAIFICIIGIIFSINK